MKITLMPLALALPKMYVEVAQSDLHFFRVRRKIQLERRMIQLINARSLVDPANESKIGEQYTGGQMVARLSGLRKTFPIRPFATSPPKVRGWT